MTKAQIKQLDDIPDGTRISVDVLGHNGLLMVQIWNGIWCQRVGRAAGHAWSIALTGVGALAAEVTLAESDLVDILAGSRKITVWR